MKYEKKLEAFITKASNKFGDTYDYSKVIYKDNRTNIIIICKIHGEINVNPGSFLYKNKFGCPKCGYTDRDDSRRLDNETFISKANVIHNNKYDYSKCIYKQTHKKVIITCPEHGDFEQVPSNHLRGHGCKQCGEILSSLNQRMTTTEFVSKAKIVHKDLYTYEAVHYEGIFKPVIIKCKKHGLFEQQPVVHLNGGGCSKCLMKNQTKLYNKLQESFPQETILWEYSPEWLGRQRFDICFPKYNLAVEYNGKQHYIPSEFFGGEDEFEIIKARDILKKQKVMSNQWSLLEIKYNYKDNDYLELINSINLIKQSFA